MSFLRGEPFIAVYEDVATDKWMCGKDGKYFRCAWCGHKFIVGDVVRCIYTNGPDEDTKDIGGNPFICSKCDGPRDEILAKLRAMAYEAKNRMWWFCT